MTIKLRDRLLYAQGGLCFFCSKPLPRDLATVEHLDARANGGANADRNCVACCEDMNSLLGSMPLKEKFRVILNQKGTIRLSQTGCARSRDAGGQVAAPTAR
jgi:5-methylcytosine-specific restriction endonuclease McrA